MKRTLTLMVVVVLAAGCSDDDQPSETARAACEFRDGTTVDDIVALRAAAHDGLVTSNDAASAKLVTPADNARVPEDPAATFQWNMPSAVNDQTVVWVEMTASSGLVSPVCVLSRGTTTWTPDSLTWERLIAVGGTVTVTVTTAQISDGTIEGDLVRPTMPSHFVIVRR